MTFTDLVNTLPNGFHDAEIEELTWNFRDNSASLIIEFWPAEKTDSGPEKYRRGRLQLSDVLFLAVDPPNPRQLDPRPYHPGPGGLHVDGILTTEKILPDLPKLMRALPANSQVYSFYIENWNSFIHIAANVVGITWFDKKDSRAVS